MSKRYIVLVAGGNGDQTAYGPYVWFSDANQFAGQVNKEWQSAGCVGEIAEVVELASALDAPRYQEPRPASDDSQIPRGWLECDGGAVMDDAERQHAALLVSGARSVS